MKEGFQFMVCTRCATYNHESYIEDALQGFAAQRTTFPFVNVIIDDASTDRTASIILDFVDSYFDTDENALTFEKVEEYGRVLLARHKTNRNCYFAVILLYENHYKKGKPKSPYFLEWTQNAKYVAFCEGDDYWINPYKLQKQVDFLEEHPDFSLCFHAANVINEKGVKKYINCEEIVEKEYDSNEIFPKWVIPTASVLYRSQVESVKVKKRQLVLYGDIVIFLSAAKVGKLWGMKEIMSVYRIHAGGFTQKETAPDYRKWIRHERCLRMNFPELNRKKLNRSIASYYYSLARNDKCLLMKFRDYCGAIINSPGYVLEKLNKAARAIILK